MHGESRLCRSSQRPRATGVIYFVEATQAELHRLDETTYRQRKRQTHLQPPHVGSGAGICKYLYEQRPEAIQLARKSQSAEPMAVILPDTQHREAGELRKFSGNKLIQRS